MGLHVKNTRSVHYLQTIYVHTAYIFKVVGGTHCVSMIPFKLAIGCDPG